MRRSQKQNVFTLQPPIAPHYARSYLRKYESVRMYESFYYFRNFVYFSIFVWSVPNAMRNDRVWALPSSLAATKGITFVLFSSGYWDVSLPQVSSTDLLCVRVTAFDAAGFPHSDISGSQVTTHLPEAYRSYVTSFIATLCQGIHHTPLTCPEGKLHKFQRIQLASLTDKL